MTTQTNTQEFDGLASQMRQSQWMACEDLDGFTEAKCTIEHVWLHRNVSFEEGRKQDKVYSLGFKGKAKQLVLNATNRRRLVALFGSKTTEWIGQTITLYVKDGVRSPKGGTTRGIRIR